MTAMITLEIDGKSIEVSPGTSIIQAADQLDIYIPRYCYHKHLSVAANCRMCLVEVEKVGKPLPACATPVAQDMKVFTQSKKTLDAQRVVLEFLLVNHPLDCPICDQGGMCELQDFSMGYGSPYSYFDEPKKSVVSENLGPLVETWMTRCIKCTRCVRFGEEVAGVRDLGVVNRGGASEISTYVGNFLHSELSGNIIDICPVGALTAKPSRYEARNWELTEVPGIALHDCVGSNVYWHMRSFQTHAARQVMATVPRENVDINQTWLSDRDRFAYCGLSHDERIYEPQMKTKSGWAAVSWQRSLLEVADKLQAIIKHQGADQLAFLASPNASTESLYLLQKCARTLGCNNIDHRLQQQDFSAKESYPNHAVEFNLEDVTQSDYILLVGSNIRCEQPMLAHRVRQAALNNAKVAVINPQDFAFNFALSQKNITHDIVHSVMQLAKAVGVEHANLQAVAVNDSIQRLAAELLQATQGYIFLGHYALDHSSAVTLRFMMNKIADKTGVKLICLTHGANSYGAWKTGVVPHRNAQGDLLEKPGLNVFELLGDSPVRAYVLLNFEPEHDVAAAEKALQALKQAGLVVCLSLYATDLMREYADFILPISPSIESSGTYYNIMGMRQHLRAASEPNKQAKPAWKILRVLANFLELDGFNYANQTELLHEIDSIEQKIEPVDYDIPDNFKPLTEGELQRYAYTPMYSVDAIVRRSVPLAETPWGETGHAGMNSNTALKYSFSAGQMITVTQAGEQLILPLLIDDSLADYIIAVAQSTEKTSGWGLGHMPISLQEAL